MYGLIKARRPARAKALIINAFALTGRIVGKYLIPRAGALGYVLIGLSARFVLLLPNPPIENSSYIKIIKNTYLAIYFCKKN